MKLNPLSYPSLLSLCTALLSFSLYPSLPYPSLLNPVLPLSLSHYTSVSLTLLACTALNNQSVAIPPLCIINASMSVGKEWVPIGSFRANEEKAIQSFAISHVEMYATKVKVFQLWVLLSQRCLFH